MRLPAQPPTIDQILTEVGVRSGGATSRGYSFWSTFQLCPYDARVIELYGRDYQSDTTVATLVGTLVHEGLAHWYQTYDRSLAMGPIDKVGQWAEENLTSDLQDFATMVWDAVHEARRLVMASTSRPQIPVKPGEYTVSISELGDPQYEFPQSMVRAIEHPLTYRGEFEYSGRIDLVLEAKDVDGSQCAVIVDHKTMFRHSDDWSESFWIDHQFLGLPFLWNEVMVDGAKGIPPCRYIVANGLVKDPKEVKNRFVREVYPVRKTRIDSWKVQMQSTWDEYTSRLDDEKELHRAGQPFDLRLAWQQRYASCHTRRYGKSIVSYLPRYPGEFSPDGGKCHRFQYCLHDSVVDLIRPESKADTRQIPLDFSRVLDKPVEPIVQETCPSPPSEVLPSTVPQTDGGSTLSFKHPFPESAEEIVYLDSITSDAMPLHEVPQGEVVYIRGSLLWNLGTKTVDDQCLVLLPGCKTPVPYDPLTLAYIAVPVMKSLEKPVDESLGKPTAETKEVEQDFVPLSQRMAEPWPQAEPHNEPVVDKPAENTTVEHGTNEPSSTAPRERRALLGTPLGHAPMAGHGIVPVFFLGAVSKGGSSLLANMKKALAEHGVERAFGAALTGRAVKKLSMVSLDDNTLEVHKKADIGNSVWAEIEAKARGLVAE